MIDIIVMIDLISSFSGYKTYMVLDATRPVAEASGLEAVNDMRTKGKHSDLVNPCFCRPNPYISQSEYSF